MTYTDRAKKMLAAAVRDNRINDFRKEWPEASIGALAAASRQTMREIARRIGNPNLPPHGFPDMVVPWPSPHTWEFVAALADRWPVLDLLDLYLDILGREPDPLGFDYWRGRLEDVGLAQVKREFVAGISDEDREIMGK